MVAEWVVSCRAALRPTLCSTASLRGGAGVRRRGLARWGGGEDEDVGAVGGSCCGDALAACVGCGGGWPVLDCNGGVWLAGKNRRA